MNLKNKRRMAARLLNVGVGRVWFDSTKLNEIKAAITNDDLRRLVGQGVILVRQKKGVSKSRLRKRILQMRKGRMSGRGSKKGKQTSRLGRKEIWMANIRAQRKLFLELLAKKAITNKIYRMLRDKAKGGFFRSRRHIKLYLTENNLWAGKK